MIYYLQLQKYERMNKKQRNFENALDGKGEYKRHVYTTDCR